MSGSGLLIRRAAMADAADIARHRVAMFSEMGSVPTAELARTLLDASICAIAAELKSENYVGWLVTEGSRGVVAGAGVHLKPQLPRISDDGTRVVTESMPLVVNVYTEPDRRQRGIARALMIEVMEWAAARGFDRVVLHASDAGRRLYTSLDFVPTNEMRWSSNLR